jgi:hypothetical protein
MKISICSRSNSLAIAVARDLTRNPVGAASQIRLAIFALQLRPHAFFPAPGPLPQFPARTTTSLALLQWSMRAGREGRRDRCSSSSAVDRRGGASRTGQGVYRCLAPFVDADPRPHLRSRSRRLATSLPQPSADVQRLYIFKPPHMQLCNPSKSNQPPCIQHEK